MRDRVRGRVMVRERTISSRTKMESRRILAFNISVSIVY
jgi:hypothetical protein